MEIILSTFARLIVYSKAREEFSFPILNFWYSVQKTLVS